MYLGYIILYLTPFTIASARSIDGRFLALSTFNTIVDGISDFASWLNYISDMFNIVLSHNITNLQRNLSVSVPEDAYLNIAQLANKYGYPFEKHTVVTEDGYILSIHRIPRGKKNAVNNIPVFLMHGILDASDSWVIQGPDRALSYILADEGFDVWMGNSRGNKHSPNHLKYNSSQPIFWQFTWEQIGVYDMPKMIDYILEKTGKDSLYYIGNSQGTTTFFVMNSMKPKYNKKIKMMYSLAPVAWMSHVRLPILGILPTSHDTLGYFVSDVNTYVPTPNFFNKVAPYVCSVINEKCYTFLQAVSGDGYRSINGTMLPIMLGHMLSGASILQFIHYAQLVTSRRFCRYDYGYQQNLKMYGDSVPPAYNLNKITVPVGLFYSGDDRLSDPYDVSTLVKSLPNVFLYEYIDGYKHLDYLYAFDVKERVFSKIIKNILDFERGDKVVPVR